MSCSKFLIKELKRSLPYFLISPFVVFILILGTKYCGWDAESEVPYLIWLLLKLRFNAESTTIFTILSIIISFVIVGLVKNFKNKLPKSEKSRFLHGILRISKYITAMYYFWAGAFFAWWWASKSISYIESIGEELMLVVMIYLMCIVIQYYSRIVRVELARK